MLEFPIMSWKRCAIVLGSVVLLCLMATGCMRTNAKPVFKTFNPPPIQPPAIESTPLLDPGSPLSDEVVQGPQEIVKLELPQLPPPQKPVVSPRPAPVKPTPAPTPPPPKITQLFDAKELREYNKTYDDSLERVRRALAILQTKNLSNAQRTTVERIRTFQMQAEQEHERDLVTAVNLARRADALAADLLRRFQ